MYSGSTFYEGNSIRMEQRTDVSLFACCDVVQGLCNHDFPDVLSMRCLTLGCGRRVGVVSSDQAKAEPAIRIIAVANSRSLIDICGLCKVSFVSSLISSDHE